MSEFIPQVGEGKVLFRFTTKPEDNVTGVDDIASEYAVVEIPRGIAGLMVYGCHPRTGRWTANWQARHVVKRMLELLQRVHEMHDEPCRYDHNGFCQAHFYSEPCLYGEIRNGIEGNVSNTR